MANNYVSKPAKKRSVTKTKATKVRINAPVEPKKPAPTGTIDWEYQNNWENNTAINEYLVKIDYAVFQAEIAVYKKYKIDVEYEDCGIDEFFIDRMSINNSELSLLDTAAMLTELHHEIEKAVPCLPGTLRMYAQLDYGFGVAACGKVNKPLEVVASEMEEYNKKYEAYEKALEEYNSPASQEARGKKLTVAQKKELEKQKKIDKLQKELDKLKKAS